MFYEKKSKLLAKLNVLSIFQNKKYISFYEFYSTFFSFYVLINFLKRFSILFSQLHGKEYKILQITPKVGLVDQGIHSLV